MKFRTTYKLIIFIMLLFAWTDVFAQEEQNEMYVVLNSSRKYKVEEVSGHKYTWKLYKNKEGSEILKFSKEGEKYVVDENGDIEEIDGLPVNICWKGVEEGKSYYLALREESILTGCYVDTDVKINVEGTPLTVKFSDKNEYKCASEDNDGIQIPLLVESKNENIIPIAYPITVGLWVKYRNEEEKAVELTLGQDDGGIAIFNYKTDGENFVEDQSQDHYFTFKFKDVKDAHGAEIKFDTDINVNKYIYGAYVKPPVTKINNK